MVNKKYVVELTGEERDKLKAMIKKGKAAAQAILKARILLKADESEQGEAWLDREICDALETNMKMVGRVREKFVNQGFDSVFLRKKRETPPRQPIFDGEAQAKLIALTCSEPPEGHARWTLRLLADKIVELEIVEEAHFNTVGRALKKTNLNRIASDTG